VIDFHGNDPRFAYYFFHTLDFARFNSGSAQPSWNRNFIHPIEVRVQDVRRSEGKVELALADPNA